MTEHLTTIGARRRLRALASLGWPNTELADHLGASASCVAAWMDQRRISPAQRDAIAVVYDRLSMKPPEAGGIAQDQAESTRHAARQCGWAPPLAWDDDVIDQAGAQPTGIADDQAPGSPAEDIVDWVIVYRAVRGWLRSPPRWLGSRPSQRKPTTAEKAAALQLGPWGTTLTALRREVGL